MMDIVRTAETKLQHLIRRVDLPPEIRLELWSIHHPLLLLKSSGSSSFAVLFHYENGTSRARSTELDAPRDHTLLA